MAKRRWTQEQLAEITFQITLQIAKYNEWKARPPALQPPHTELKQTGLAYLERQLQKIKAGTYGKCDACKKPIPDARLTILLGATRCATCQERIERLARTKKPRP